MLDKKVMKDEKNILIIHDLFDENKEMIEDEEIIYKTKVYKILFENFVIDILGYNIFFFEALLDKIESEKDFLTLEQFLHFFIFVFNHQVKNYNTNELNIQDHQDENLKNMIKEGTDLIYNDEIFNNSVNIVRSLFKIRNKNELNFHSCYPEFNQNILINLFKKENIKACFSFNDHLKEIFDEIAEHNETDKISLLNLFDLFQILKKCNANCHLDATKISEVLTIFLLPNRKLDFALLTNILDDIDYSKERDILSTLLEEVNLNLKEINFTFSNFVLILAMMSFFYKFPEEEKINDDVKRIDTFFNSNLEIERNKLNKSISIKSEKKEIIEEEEEFCPSRRLEEAIKQQMEKNFSPEDTNFLMDTLVTLDKELTDNSYINIIKQTQNPINNTNINNFPISHVNNNLITGKIDQPYIFPQKPLKIEIDEQKKKALEDYNNAQILAAKKKENKKDKSGPKRPAQWEEKLDPVKEKLKYLGTKTIEDMKHRFFKLSYKDTIVNTLVYPSLLREIMILPKSLSKEVNYKLIQIAEYVLLSYKFQTEGKLDMAISVFEKVKELQTALNIKNDLQVELFININLGNIYESLGLYMQALRYYMDSRTYADKMDSINPDSAIAYANLGSLVFYLGSCFYHIREAEWAFRCFWKAKETREYTIGGDTLDTAAIYNNLGCCLFCLQNYYTAFAFFKLAFEIYHKLLGPLHSRTLLIKGNLDKLNQLNFSKPFEYKPMSLIPAYWMTSDNSKKKKK